jgi:ankyrin repeat protein
LCYCKCAEAVALLFHNKDINIDAIASGAATGGTAVYLSVIFGTTAVLRLLVDAGASIEFPDKYTALEAAIFYRHPETTDYLLGMGAPVVFRPNY